MTVERIAIDASVGEVFPPERLRDELDDLDQGVAVLDEHESLAGFDAVVTFAYRDDHLEADWIHSIQAGVDRFPFDELEANGVVLTNSTGIHGNTVGETVAGYLLMFARRLHDTVVASADGEWSPPSWDEPFTVEGERLCVVGLGTLGRGIAERAGALGMTVTGVRRSGDPVEGVERVHEPDRLLEAVADARFVAIAVPLTDETRHLFGAREFEAMRGEAVLINVARGPVVDESALVDAVCDGEIAGAALDVFEEEPLPDDSPLWGMDEVVITPHCAAFTRDYYRDIADLVRANATREAGGDWTNRVV